MKVYEAIALDNLIWRLGKINKRVVRVLNNEANTPAINGINKDLVKLIADLEKLKTQEE